MIIADKKDWPSLLEHSIANEMLGRGFQFDALRPSVSKRRSGSLNTYEITLPISGMKLSDFTWDIGQGILTIRCSGKRTSGEPRYVSISKVFVLPSDSDESSISATYNNDVFKVLIGRKTAG